MGMRRTSLPQSFRQLASNKTARSNPCPVRRSPLRTLSLDRPTPSARPGARQSGTALTRLCDATIDNVTVAKVSMKAIIVNRKNSDVPANSSVKNKTM